MKKLLLSIASLALLGACAKQNSDNAVVVEKPQIQVQDGRFTPEVMWGLGVMSEYAVSPDGSQVLYTVRYTDMEQNKNNAELYLMPIAGGDGERLTTSAPSEFNPVWFDDNTIMFCRGNQILSMNLDKKKETTSVDAGNTFGDAGVNLNAVPNVNLISDPSFEMPPHAIASARTA